jgi:hypothetical protein
MNLVMEINSWINYLSINLPQSDKSICRYINIFKLNILAIVINFKTSLSNKTYTNLTMSIPYLVNNFFILTLCRDNII